MVRVLPAAVVAGALLTGCSASRKVAEQCEVSIEREEAVTRNLDELTAAAAAIVENIVIERPEIIVTDSASRRSVIIRGERLEHGRAAVEASESVRQECVDSAASSAGALASRRDVAGNMKAFRLTDALLAAAIAAAILWLLKKRG
ncbi:MAG: hypothetical protein HDS69_00960 [Bacteroidales bacterium]|nr:hypothetical protein [Bacteroidales bacterium]